MSFFDRFKSKKEQEVGASGVAEVAQVGEETPKAADGAEAAPKKKTAKKSKAKKTTEETKQVPETSTKIALDRAAIVKPLVTEKTAFQAADGKYAFEIGKNTSKVAVRQAIEAAYKVHVEGVRVINVRGKHVRFGRTAGQQQAWKKAIVTLRKGERLDIYEEKQAS